MDWTKLISELMAAGVTQSSIGEACGLTQSAISDLYRGITKQPSFSTGQRLIELHEEHCHSLKGASE